MTDAEIRQVLEALLGGCEEWGQTPAAVESLRQAAAAALPDVPWERIAAMLQQMVTEAEDQQKLAQDIQAIAGSIWEENPELTLSEVYARLADIDPARATALFRRIEMSAAPRSVRPQSAEAHLVEDNR